MKLLLVFVANVVFSWFSLKLLYSFLRRKKIFDLPNIRSLHTEPKVSAGGLAILLSYSLFTFLLFLFDYISLRLMLSQLIGGFILGIVGWFDDIKNMPIVIRFSAHICISIITLIFFNGFFSIHLLDRVVYLSIIGNIIMVIYITWLINLYNFMDGIDGIAISQAIIPSIFLVVFFGYKGYYEVLYLAIIMIISSMFFYKYNWAPSKMFMGDVLSSFLGYYFAVLTLYINNILKYSFFLIPILMAIFIFDASFTLIKRIFKKEKIWIAHSSHFYQQFAKIYGHRNVSIVVIIINIFLFFPAFLVLRYQQYDLYITILTYSFLGLLIFVLKKKLLYQNKEF